MQGRRIIKYLESTLYDCITMSFRDPQPIYRISEKIMYIKNKCKSITEKRIRNEGGFGKGGVGWYLLFSVGAKSSVVVWIKILSCSKGYDMSQLTNLIIMCRFLYTPLFPCHHLLVSYTDFLVHCTHLVTWVSSSFFSSSNSQNLQLL